MAEPVSMATILAISALGQAASAGGASYFGGKAADRQARLQQQQWQSEFDFQKDQAAKIEAERRRQALQQAPGTSMSWLQMLQGLSQGSAKPTSLDAIGYLARR